MGADRFARFFQSLTPDQRELWREVVRGWTAEARLPQWPDSEPDIAEQGFRVAVEFVIESVQRGLAEDEVLLAAAYWADEIRSSGEKVVCQLVAQAVGAGASWSTIARWFGVSRQAVQQRFGRFAARPPVGALRP